MAICREFYFSSSDGSSRIHAAEWTPEGHEIIGVLQIAHGVAEYAMRYAPFAEFMTEHGFVVVANDHLGHGLSAEKDAETLYFGPYNGWKHVVDDMYALRCRTKEKYPDVPYFLMGHSMGSFLTRTYLIRYPGTVDAAIIMGTGHQSPAVVAGGRAIAKAAGKRHGFKAHSPRVENLAFGAYNKAFAPNRTSLDWLSASDNNVDAYIADPLCGQKTSIGLFYEMLGGIRFVSAQKNINSMNLNTPILFISALTGQRVNKLFAMINHVCEQSMMRIRTGTLNSVLADATTRVQPPTDRGRRLKIYYMTQVGIQPPTFVVFCNDAKLFHFSYQRYLENQIRNTFGLEGTPIRLIIRAKGEKGDL